MAFCKFCGKEIHISALTCPHCGGVQHSSITVASSGQAGHSDDGKLSMPITSLVVGIVSLCTLFDDSPWDKETIAGVGVFAIISLVLGCVSINKQRAGRRMAIAGVGLSSLTLLALLSLSVSK